MAVYSVKVKSYGDNIMHLIHVTINKEAAYTLVAMLKNLGIEAELETQLNTSEGHS